MVKRKRRNRTSDMDDALFEALKTSVPPKDTGPEPEDILAGLFEEELRGEGLEKDGKQTAGALQFFSIGLDEKGLERAQAIVDLVKAHTGEQMEVADVLKTLLFCPRPQKEQIVDAFSRCVAKKAPKT